MQIKDGDFVVMKDRWRLRSVQAIKVTAKTVFYRDAEWNNRECRIRVADIVFSGSQDTAKLLADRLRSSYDLCTTERAAAEKRRIERDAKYIEKAAAERASGTDPKTGEYSTAQMMADEMSGGDTSQPLFD